MYMSFQLMTNCPLDIFLRSVVKKYKYKIRHIACNKIYGSVKIVNLYHDYYYYYYYYYY